MFRIRKASLNDFNAVYRLINELEGTTLDKRRQRQIYKRNLSDPNVTYLVAEHNGEVSGFLSCHIQLLLHHCAAVAEIQEMIVSESVRGKKIGQKLLDDLRKRMRRRGINQVEAVSNMKRKRAHDFYLRNRFKKTSCKFVLRSAESSNAED